MRVIILGLAGLAAVGAGAVWMLSRTSFSSGPPTAAPAVKPRTNVVIVLIDTLRADRLGCYGHARPTSPRIDGLARESVLFQRACAPSPWTLPTVPSLMTSTLPCEHQVLVDG